MKDQESIDSINHRIIETEYTRIKEDIFLRLRSVNQFELGAVTAMGLILAISTVFGDGGYFIGNVAVGIVLFGCARAVVPTVRTLYDAHAFIGVRIELGHYPSEWRWDDYWNKPQKTDSRSRWHHHFHMNHHSILFLSLGLANIIILLFGMVSESEYVAGSIALIPCLAVIWPILSINKIYSKSSRDKRYNRWKDALNTQLFR